MSRVMIDGRVLTSTQEQQMHIAMETYGERSPAQCYQAEATAKNTQRWSGQTCERVAGIFQLMGYQGYTCEVLADGSLRFTGVSSAVPAYLRCDEDEVAAPELLRVGGGL